MNEYIKKIIEELDAALYSNEALTFNVFTLIFFKNILRRWLNKVEENIKYLEENNG